MKTAARNQTGRRIAASVWLVLLAAGCTPAGKTNDGGPAGPLGQPNVAGDQVVAGPAGPQGPQGDPGDPGYAGPEGPQGAVGPKGDKGDTGATGAAGPAGPIGPAGPAGPAGPKGDTGAAGPTGPMGPAGGISTINASTTAVNNKAVKKNDDVEVARLRMPAAGYYYVTANMTVSRSTGGTTGLACRFGADASSFEMAVQVPRPYGKAGAVLTLSAPVKASNDGNGNDIVRLVCTNQANNATFSWSALLSAFPISSVSGYAFNG